MPSPLLALGMISPLARTASEHAFFLRAGVLPATPGAFRNAEGDTINASYCPWLGASLPPAARLIALASSALHDALASLLARTREAPTLPVPRLALFVCTSAPRDGLAEADRAALEAHLASQLSLRAAVRSTGAAGFFHSLIEAEALLGKGDHHAAVIVAADTMISPPALAELARQAHHPWASSPPRPSEGAVAILLGTDEAARKYALTPLARLAHAAVLGGKANDDNDEIVDGAAMTALLRGVPGNLGPISAAYGQQGVDPLRTREWHVATARNVARFHREALFESIETWVGRLGAAAGAMSLAWGAVSRRHRTWERTIAGEGGFAAWAISPDGLRGIAIVDDAGRSAGDAR